MNLDFGYGRGVPDTVHTAWGARLIVTQDGTTDLVPNRQDLVAKDDASKDALIEWLNGGGIGYVRKWIEDLLSTYVMRTRESEEFTGVFVGGAHAVANTNASAGYCYVAVYLDEHDERGDSTFRRIYPASAFDEHDKHRGPGPWLDVIRRANSLAAGLGLDPLFGAPTYSDDKPGVEQYADAEVADFRYPDMEDAPEDGSREALIDRGATSRRNDARRDAWLRDPRNVVTITSKTPLGARVLAAAAADRYGRTWGLSPGEACVECGQPDNCGECEHGRLSVADVALLGGRVSDAEWDTLPPAVRDTLDPGGAPFEVVGVLSYDPESDTLSPGG